MPLHIFSFYSFLRIRCFEQTATGTVRETINSVFLDILLGKKKERWNQLSPELARLLLSGTPGSYFILLRLASCLRAACFELKKRGTPFWYRRPEIIRVARAYLRPCLFNLVAASSSYTETASLSCRSSERRSGEAKVMRRFTICTV